MAPRVKGVVPVTATSPARSRIRFDMGVESEWRYFFPIRRAALALAAVNAR